MWGILILPVYMQVIVWGSRVLWLFVCKGSCKMCNVRICVQMIVIEIVSVNCGRCLYLEVGVDFCSECACVFM